MLKNDKKKDIFFVKLFILIKKHLIYHNIYDILIYSINRSNRLYERELTKMADFNVDDMFDKIKSGVVNASKSAGDFAKNAATKLDNKTQEAKFRFTARELESKLNGYYCSIGKAVYKAYTNGEEAEDFSETFGRIDAVKEEIELLKSRIADMNDSAVCTSCGAYVGKDDVYCPKCGMKLKDDE